jgi:hypothetical protein
MNGGGISTASRVCRVWSPTEAPLDDTLLPVIMSFSDLVGGR